jgi:uncharacterized protein
VSDVVNAVRNILLTKCVQHKEHTGYDYWNDHIKRVVDHAVILANKYEADLEIVELGALLHDISMPSEYGARNEHNIFSAEMTETILSELNYPKEKIEAVKKCVFNHSGGNRNQRGTIEEWCVSDADALAHFDRIPSLFSLAYNLHKMSLDEGREYVKKRLQGDFDDLSERSKLLYVGKYDTIMETVFVD